MISRFFGNLESWFANTGIVLTRKNHPAIIYDRIFIPHAPKHLKTLNAVEGSFAIEVEWIRKRVLGNNMHRQVRMPIDQVERKATLSF